MYLDLLESDLFTRLLANPNRLEQYIPDNFGNYVVIDEVQRVPALLNEVHRLIESKKIKFVLTGSGARKLRRGGHNLLAGRAITYKMFPLTALEMGGDFDIQKAVIRGLLPMAQNENFQEYLKSYIQTYLEQEILQEGLTRNLAAFSRFLEIASYSQGQILNISSVARDAEIERKVVEGYFGILKDLLIGYTISPFTKRAKRRLVSHPKFYYFDSGVYRAIRPSGPLDSPEEIGGLATETLILQQIVAINEYLRFDYKVYFYRTATGIEVDFVLYGPKGLVAIEVKRTDKLRQEAVSGLKKFKEDYPEAKLFLLYGGKRKMKVDGITVLPLQEACLSMDKWIS